MNSIRVVIVDDEPLARRNIELLLEEDPVIHIHASLGDPRDALEVIRIERPELVFLDMKMPEMNGIELMEQLYADHTGPLPYFILVTAYDYYAVKAFEFHALDYLVKPFRDQRFRQALAHAKAQIGRGRQPIQGFLTHAGGTRPRRLLIEESGKITFLEHGEILWLEAADHYVIVCTEENRFVIRKSLKDLQLELAAGRFLRVHRATLVNMDHVSSIERPAFGEARLRMTNGAAVKISRRRYPLVKQQLARQE